MAPHAQNVVTLVGEAFAVFAVSFVLFMALFKLWSDALFKMWSDGDREEEGVCSRAKDRRPTPALPQRVRRTPSHVGQTQYSSATDDGRSMSPPRCISRGETPHKKISSGTRFLVRTFSASSQASTRSKGSRCTPRVDSMRT